MGPELDQGVDDVETVLNIAWEQYYGRSELDDDDVTKHIIC